MTGALRKAGQRSKSKTSCVKIVPFTNIHWECVASYGLSYVGDLPVLRGDYGVNSLLSRSTMRTSGLVCA